MSTLQSNTPISDINPQTQVRILSDIVSAKYKTPETRIEKIYRALNTGKYNIQEQISKNDVIPILSMAHLDQIYDIASLLSSPQFSYLGFKKEWIKNILEGKNTTDMDPLLWRRLLGQAVHEGNEPLVRFLIHIYREYLTSQIIDKMFSIGSQSRDPYMLLFLEDILRENGIQGKIPLQ